ncbi:MAG TPA: anti-sigma factor [Thermoanaerobaculia bacterium]
MNGEAQTEDLTILAALESLERGIEAPRDAVSLDETSETLSRLYTEVLGLIPYELAPVAPAAGVKTRLMAAIGAEARPAVPMTATAAEPARVAPPVPLQEPRASRPAAPPPPAARPARASRWPLALAAVLALALLGLSAWLYSQVGAQRATIAGLRHQLSLERVRSEGAVARVRQLENEGFDLQQNLSLVSSRAVLVSPMRPVARPGQAPLQPDAHGTLFVAADHQHWYMSLQGLQPAPAGQVYKLWFVADHPVSSGSFTARPGEPMALSSQQMPAGTKGAIVTLESDPNAPAPTGPAILQAAPPYEVS